MNFKIPHKLTKLDSQGISQLNLNFAYLNQFFQQSPFTKWGDGTNFTEIGNSGNIIFKGTAGLQFGSMGQENVPTTVNIVSSGVAVIIDGMTGGEVNGITFQNSKELKVAKAGKYFITWAISFNMVSGSGNEIEGRIGIGGSAQVRGSAHRKIGTSNDTGNMGSSAVLDLAANNLITVMIENDTNTTNIVIAHASLVMIQLAGT